ncbi:MAG TPA: hypothetical protein VF323_03980 [Candidatus Limnocylindrales bacterium]
MPKATETDGSLKRLGGGRWQTRDDRFTIEPQSGTWVVVDAEQTDDLGLALVRGPFGSLTAAREVIASARDAAPAVSPLAAQMAKLRDRSASATSDDDHRPGRRSATTPKPKPEPKPAPTPAAPEPPAEARWIRDLEPIERRRAHELMARLARAGVADPEGMARRELVGKVPAAAAFAVARAIRALGPEASPADVARLLADGRDADLGVRWRLVDGDDRPIVVDLAASEPR